MAQPEKKKIIFSGVQPSGTPTLGNYLGAFRNWSSLQTQYDCIYCVVDLHSITVRQDPELLRRHSHELVALLLAVGIDPEQSILIIQSHVRTHAELAWVLNCYTQFGELSRMTQFKEKSKRHTENINAGLFTYPALMAADILLYQTDLVPVGADQKQHVELAREVAERFNGLYGKVFNMPDVYIPEAGARVMSLLEPTKKMSKSDDNPNSFILLTDKPDVIINKFKRAVTDSESRIEYREGKDGINNLIGIYCSVTGKTIKEAEKEFEGKGYGEFKLAVGEAVAQALKPIQEKYEELLKNSDYVKKVYTDSSRKALEISQKTVDIVYEKVGFVKREI
jgi:tryptophanyl-tRNA synthetase